MNEKNTHNKNDLNREHRNGTKKEEAVKEGGITAYNILKEIARGLDYAKRRKEMDDEEKRRWQGKEPSMTYEDLRKAYPDELICGKLDNIEPDNFEWLELFKEKYPKLSQKLEEFFQEPGADPDFLADCFLEEWSDQPLFKFALYYIGNDAMKVHNRLKRTRKP